jgi:hypothetical protein
LRIKHKKVISIFHKYFVGSPLSFYLKKQKTTNGNLCLKNVRNCDTKEYQLSYFQTSVHVIFPKKKQHYLVQMLFYCYSYSFFDLYKRLARTQPKYSNIYNINQFSEKFALKFSVKNELCSIDSVSDAIIWDSCSI